jgi:hypothetical protein
MPSYWRALGTGASRVRNYMIPELFQIIVDPQQLAHTFKCQSCP